MLTSFIQSYTCGGVLEKSNSMADMGAHEVVIEVGGSMGTLEVTKVCGCVVPVFMQFLEEGHCAIVGPFFGNGVFLPFRIFCLKSPIRFLNPFYPGRDSFYTSFAFNVLLKAMIKDYESLFLAREAPCEFRGFRCSNDC